MTDATPPSGDDSILPFQLDALDVRGRIARLDATIDEILTQHDYPPAVSGLVAEATLLTALIGQTIKSGDRFSIQVRGNGAVTMLATDYFAPVEPGAAARMRAYAAFDADALGETEGIALLGEGLMGVTIDAGTGKQPYQGITPLSGATLAECTETYFAQSEQLATRFALAAAQSFQPGQSPQWRAGGIVIQHLPKASPLRDRGGEPMPDEPGSLMSGDDVAALTGEQDNWRTAALKLETVEDHELIGPHITRRDVLLRLFHEDAPRVYDAQSVAFGCTCGAAKLEDVLIAQDRAQLEEMAEDGRITADCQFCGAQYVFEVDELVREGKVQ